MEKNPALKVLNSVGQSIWYDNLSRDVLRSGTLEKYIAAGVSGLTSNPTIFKKAIADTSHYDEDIRNLAAEGLSSEAICEELFIRDVGAAADLLKPTFIETSRADGYASIEVSPLLANDTQKTIEAARHLWGRLGRPNIMIKVPATKEGIPAIRELLDSGLNINVTLIFSVEVYREVAKAYIAALQSRAERKEAISAIRSVASFFVSRVDSIFEENVKRLVSSGRKKEGDFSDFLGKVGIANSREAYKAFLEIFGTEEFRKLQSQGALVQRPLWASTGVKNPAYSPLLYVETLAGKDTVNTLPPRTLDTLLEGVTLTDPQPVTEDADEASRLLASLGEKGIDFEALLQQLEVDGVRIFSDSYSELIQSVENKKEILMKG